MKLLPLKPRAIKIIDQVDPKYVNVNPVSGGLELMYDIKKSHMETQHRWLHVSIKPTWRDLWLGVFIDTGRVYVCVVPCLPLVFTVK